MIKTNGGATKPDPDWLVDAVRQIQAGTDCERNFERIFRTYGERVERYMKRRGLEPSTAGDLAQDAMIRVWKGLGAFDWRSSVQTWIFTVARNVYLNHRRHLQTKRAKAERDSLDALLEQTVDGKRAPPSGLTSRDLDPAARAEHAERVHLANASIDAMPKRMRQCFLARQADLSYGDIGRLYDVQPDTVKKHLRAGRQRLRSLFTVFAGLVSTLGWALRALERTGG